MPVALSLFSGAGGCSLGLSDAGFEVALAVDNNKDACMTYESNLRHHNVWNRDIATLQSDLILERAQLNQNQVDIIVGGPPCQGFSSAGARDWDDPRNALLKKFVEIVVNTKPIWFIMENVEGLLTAKNGFFVIETITRFLEAGYWVKAEKVYMEKYGVPQKRKRVIIIGNLEGADFEFPDFTHEATEPTMFSTNSQLSVLDAISDLPNPTIDGLVTYTYNVPTEYQQRLHRTDTCSVSQHQTKEINEVIQERINHLQQGKTMKDLPVHLQHASFSKRANRRVMDGTPTEKRGGSPSGMKRLVSYESALTITSAAPEDIAGRWLGIKATKASAMSPALTTMLSELEKKVASYA